MDGLAGWVMGDDNNIHVNKNECWHDDDDEWMEDNKGNRNTKHFA